MTKKGKPSQERPGYIYMIECRAPGEAFGKVYVGQTVNEESRLANHLSGRLSNKALSADVCLYGDEVFVIHRGVIPYYTADELDVAEFAEIKLQREMRGAQMVYNVAHGGGRHPIIAAARISAARSSEDKSAAARKRAVTMGFDRLSDCMRKAKERMGPERLKEASRKRQETMGFDGRRAQVRKANENLGPEGRKARSRKAMETMGLEGRRDRARRRVASMGPERLKDVSRKARETLGPEGRSALARKRAENLGLGRLQEIWRKGRATLGVEGQRDANRKNSETKRALAIIGFRSKAEMARWYCAARAAELSNTLSNLRARAVDLELGLTA
ncbi:hypothetical protein [Methylocystis parvus]|uniref:hypothetical protein n=1 Tax=Methylocystis parvus TaxID=134 RepID=UPI003C787FCE